MRRIIIVAVIGTVGSFLTSLGYATETNGIVVGAPKQFPNRHLEVMIEDLDRQLEQLRFVTGAPLSAALGSVQGYQTRSVERSLDLRSLPTPAIETTRQPDEEGNQVESQKVTSAAYSPTPPTLSGAPPTAPVDSTGFSAQDLLTEQLNLQYQVYNLRALLNRSIGDRYYSDGSGTTGSRLQVLLGFQISLDPPKKHRGQAAVVKIAVKHKDTGKQRPSLVAMMPQEKTYNAAALSKKSNAFGGAAISSVLTVGYSEKRTGETFYLYQDADTLAFEAPRDSAEKSLSFGWQFRPVLDRPGVQGGLRQMFAVLALDEKDPPSGPVLLEIEATTYWVPYDRKRRMTKGEPTDDKSFLFDDDFVVLSTSALELGLTPEVTDIEVETRDKNVLVKVRGEKFFSDSSVAVGDRILNPGSSDFVVHSNTRLQFVVPKEDLFERISLTGGRYSFPAPLEIEAFQEDGNCHGEVGFSDVRLSAKAPVKGAFRDVTVSLGRVQASHWRLPHRTVFLRFGDHIYELPHNRWHPPDEASEFSATVEIPVADLLSDQEFEVLVPFLGSSFQGVGRYHPPVGVNTIVVLDEGNPDKNELTVWGISGHGFTEDHQETGRATIPGQSKGVRVFAGKEYSLGAGLERVDDHLLRLSAPKADLAKVKKVIIRMPGRSEPITLPAPTINPQPTPSVITSPTLEVAESSSPHVVFRGENLNQIASVTYAGKTLSHHASSATALTVFLTREVTKTKGQVSLVASTEAGRVLALPILVK